MRLDYFKTTFKTTPIIVLLWGVLLLLTPTSAAQDVSTATLRSMARLYMAYGNYDKAQTAAQMALAQAEGRHIDGEEMAMCLIDLGTVYSYQDMLEESAEMLSQGVLLQKKAVGNHPYAAYTLQMLCDVYRREGQYDRAEETLDEAFSIMRCYTRESRELLALQASRARLMTSQGELKQANALYAEILDKTIETCGSTHLQTAAILSGYAEAELLEGKIESARGRIDQAIEIQEKYFGSSHHMLIPVWLVKARISRAAGNTTDAEIWLNKAIELTQSGHNVVAVARIHEKANAIRAENAYVAMTQ